MVAVNEDEVEAAVGHVHRRFDGELPPQLGARREAREDLRVRRRVSADFQNVFKRAGPPRRPCSCGRRQ